MPLAVFLVRRVLLGIVVMWVVATAAFVLFFVLPHDPASVLAGNTPAAGEVTQITGQLGLRQPLPIQYWHYLARLAHGNLGTSSVDGSPVAAILRQDLPPTLSLMAGGAALWLLAGVGAGLLSATRARTLADRIITVGLLAGVTIPTFVLGLLLLAAIYVPLNRAGFHWIQTGYEGPTTSLVGWAGHMILPWITIAAVSSASYARLTRGALLDVLGEDYIVAARAKGLTERRVLYRHAVRAALTPVVSQLGVDVGTLAGGAVVTESVFGLGGIGQQALTSYQAGDAPVVLGIVLCAAAFVVAANLLADLLYSVLDPRVRLA